jgi:uncharacterized protein YdeI (YjbR/CyaY-like superfamily)
VLKLIKLKYTENIMRTKNGKAVPLALVAALRAKPELYEMWGKLRPSCQCRYVKLVEKAKRPETKARRIDMVVGMTAAWYKRHYDKINARKMKVLL